LVQKALSARRAEFLRWHIKAELADATAATEVCSCGPTLFQAILHVTQFCVEQLRESTGASRLFVGVQTSGERLETIFLCESSGTSESANLPKTGSFPYESLRSKNVELRAAQKLLDTMGGTLVLENISETQRAVRMYLSTSALAVERNLNEQSRI
jgi:hypothetical protein